MASNLETCLLFGSYRAVREIEINVGFYDGRYDKRSYAGGRAQSSLWHSLVARVPFVRQFTRENRPDVVLAVAFAAARRQRLELPFVF